MSPLAPALKGIEAHVGCSEPSGVTSRFPLFQREERFISPGHNIVVSPEDSFSHMSQSHRLCPQVVSMLKEEQTQDFCTIQKPHKLQQRDCRQYRGTQEGDKNDTQGKSFRTLLESRKAMFKAMAGSIQ